MHNLSKAVSAALWTVVLISTVVVVVDAQERSRYDQEARDETRTQVDIVRSNLGEALDRRFAVADRLSAFVELDPEFDDERFQAYAASLGTTRSGVRGMWLVPHEGDPFVYPATADDVGVRAATAHIGGDTRILGPYQVSNGTRALLLQEPVYVPIKEEPGASRHWGAVWLEFYLDPLLGEAKVTGWPGEATFALRGADGAGASGALFYGDESVFAERPASAMVVFRGGTWEVAAIHEGGWPTVSPVSWWIRLGGGFLAVLAGILVGVVTSEPARLRQAVVEATRAAQDSEQRFRAVSDTAQDAIVTVDAVGRVAYVNRAAEGLYRTPAYRLVGRLVDEVLPREAAAMRRRGHEQQGDGEPVAAAEELVSLRPDGGRTPVEVSFADFQAGGRSYTTAIIRDVTERRRAMRVQGRLAAALDSTPDFVAIADADGRMTYANQSARRVLGLDADGVDGGSLADAWPERLRAGLWQRALEEASAHGAWRGEGAILSADGTEVPVSQVLLAHKNDDGAVESLAVIARDMTEERRVREELQRGKERFRTLSEAAFEGIVIHDQGEILELNNAFATMFGYTTEELIGRNVLDLVAEEERLRIEHQFKEPRDEPYEVECVRRDGSRFTVEVAAKHYPFQDRMARVTAVRDVTERKKAETAQRVALERLMEIERLKEMDQFKTQLLNTASHELNTPITPIRLQLHLLKNSKLGPLNPKHQKAVEVLDRNVERLAYLVQDVLDVARMESGRLRVYREPARLDVLVREAVEAFEEPARQARITLAPSLEDGLWVLGDNHRLTQVLFNLLSNALKFTPEHGTVRVVARVEDGAAVVEVQDTGAGLTQEQIARLFRPFSQVHDTMEKTRAGTGLGLYICRGIVQEHAGRIWAKGDGPGKGATFGFAIPLAAAEDLQDFQQDEATPRRSRSR